MSTNNVNKEFIFNLFLKFYPEVMSNLTGYNLIDLELEKNYYDRKIDAYTKLDNREIFIESQLTKADNQHFAQIEYIIDNLTRDNEATIIWISKEFYENIINEIEEKIKNSEKNIEFISIAINDDLLDELDLFSNINEFEIIENLHRLQPKLRLEVVSRYYRRFASNEIHSQETIQPKFTTEKEEIMQKILEEVRTQLHYFPGVYKERKMDGGILVLGGGTSDIVYGAGINRRNQVYVELKFNENTKEIFDLLYERKDEVDNYFDYLIDWDCEYYKIYSSHFYCGNLERVIKRQVRILDRLVQYFTRFKATLDEKNVGSAGV